MLQVTLTGGPAGWGINNTFTNRTGKTSIQSPEELTMVVSVTEPKLLIKILHVTFTGGPVKWNDNDTTGGNKAFSHMFQRGVWGEREFGVVAFLCIQTCFNTTSSLGCIWNYICFFCLSVPQEQLKSNLTLWSVMSVDLMMFVMMSNGGNPFGVICSLTSWIEDSCKRNQRHANTQSGTLAQEWIIWLAKFP